MIDVFNSVTLLAHGSGVLTAKALLGLFIFGGMAVVSYVGLFANKQTLLDMSDTIGTRNPTAARIVCGLGAVVCSIFVVGCVLVLCGIID